MHCVRHKGGTVPFYLIADIQVHDPHYRPIDRCEKS
jgi:hypothetical protein